MRWTDGGESGMQEWRQTMINASTPPVRLVARTKGAGK